MRLFCFPYAGAGASGLQSWGSSFAPEIEVGIIQLPGREDRLAEPCCRSLQELIEVLAINLPFESDKPFAIFGHSLGALIGFELARYLRRSRQSGPVQLFISAKGAPQNPSRYPFRLRMSDTEFIGEIRRLGGTSEEVLCNRDLMELLMPIFRADFGLHDSYVYRPETPLSCPITAFAGEVDPEAKPEQMMGWRDQTSGHFALEVLEGDHFFLHHHRRRIIEIIGQELHSRIKETAGLRYSHATA